MEACECYRKRCSEACCTCRPKPNPGCSSTGVRVGSLPTSPSSSCVFLHSPFRGAGKHAEGQFCPGTTRKGAGHASYAGQATKPQNYRLGAGISRLHAGLPSDPHLSSAARMKVCWLAATSTCRSRRISFGPLLCFNYLPAFKNEKISHSNRNGIIGFF
jgi:hypothetical protein